MTASIVSRIVIDGADLRAYMRDLCDIFVRYGTPADVQPHNRAALEKEMARAGAVLDQCFRVE